MKVTTKELRETMDLLLSHLEDSGKTEFELEEDYYWSVPPADRYSPYEEPKVFTLGQLSDDLEELRSIRAGEKEPLGYALVWLSSVLTRVGEKAKG